MKQKEFIREFVLAILTVIAGLSVLTSCEDEWTSSNVTAYSSQVLKSESSLVHHWDTAHSSTVSDVMDATLKVWQQENNTTEELYNEVLHPMLTAASGLRLKDYYITDEQINASVVKTSLKHGNSVGSQSTDTVYVDYSDGQCDSVIVKISHYSTAVGGQVYNHGSLSVLSAIADKVSNTELETQVTTAATNNKAAYRTQYVIRLTVQEKDVTATPKVFEVLLYTYTNRYIKAETKSSNVAAENKNRVALNISTERCSFDKVTTLSDGQQLREYHEIVLNHKFEAQTLSKKANSFNYAFKSSTGVGKGSSVEVRRESNWIVYGRTDLYSATLSNGTAAENIITQTPLYHEYAVYKDGDFEVVFGYEQVRISELSTNVTVNGNTAVINHKIQTEYIGLTQDLLEKFSLQH